MPFNHDVLMVGGRGCSSADAVIAIGKTIIATNTNATVGFRMLMECSHAYSSSRLVSICLEITVDFHKSSMYPNRSGATIVASLSITNLGVSSVSFPQVIFSFGGAPEYPPYEGEASLI